MQEVCMQFVKHPCPLPHTPPSSESGARVCVCEEEEKEENVCEGLFMRMKKLLRCDCASLRFVFKRTNAKRERKVFFFCVCASLWEIEGSGRA